MPVRKTIAQILEQMLDAGTKNVLCLNHEGSLQGRQGKTAICGYIFVFSYCEVP
jgi:hypothetical protein